ncbi:hypothetical protein DL96DRAFT_1575673 [Flagelloscypha sp. PMI_526]|nr:hypothetical protein DL96DRAFT_1575673 [Flagelloscypha sp. PMI_526]
MASLALPRVRQSVFTLSWRALDLPLPSFWQTLFPPIVLAVPKSRTTHSAKRMRNAIKGLKEKTNIVHCPACGNPKLAHHLCPVCTRSIFELRKKDRTRAMEEHGAPEM